MREKVFGSLEGVLAEAFANYKTLVDELDDLNSPLLDAQRTTFIAAAVKEAESAGEQSKGEQLVYDYSVRDPKLAAEYLECCSQSMSEEIRAALDEKTLRADPQGKNPLANAIRVAQQKVDRVEQRLVEPSSQNHDAHDANPSRFEEAQYALADYVKAREAAGIASANTVEEWGHLSYPQQDKLEKLMIIAAQKLAAVRVAPDLPEHAKWVGLLLETNAVSKDKGIQVAYRNAATYFKALNAVQDYMGAGEAASDAQKDTLRERAANLLAAAYCCDYDWEVRELIGSEADETHGVDGIDKDLKELCDDKIITLGKMHGTEAYTTEALKRVAKSPVKTVEGGGTASRILSMSNVVQK